MSHHEAAVYRRRAEGLRTFASEISTTSSLSLDSHAGVDTWFGPRADSCTTDLNNVQGAVRSSIDDLRIQAQRFDDTADQLEAAAWAAEHEAGRLRAEKEARRVRVEHERGLS